jgi:hypothetical protein
MPWEAGTPQTAPGQQEPGSGVRGKEPDLPTLPPTNPTIAPVRQEDDELELQQLCNARRLPGWDAQGCAGSDWLRMCSRRSSNKKGVSKRYT